jgi:hypothetical protein
MRHARADALARLHCILRLVRATPGLREPSPGTFYRGARAFLHFHEDGPALYADIRLHGEAFERVAVTTPAEQRALGRRIASALQPAH